MKFLHAYCFIARKGRQIYCHRHRLKNLHHQYRCRRIRLPINEGMELISITIVLNKI